MTVIEQRTTPASWIRHVRGVFGLAGLAIDLVARAYRLWQQFNH